MDLPENFIKSVEKAELRAGDLLFLRVGVSAEDMGPGHNAWFPSEEELRRIHADVSAELPEGVILFVTHMGVKPEVVTPDDDEEGVGGTD